MPASLVRRDVQVLPSLQLTYCTNIHPGHGWDEVRTHLERVAPRLKQALSPRTPFGLGLRLSAVEARELLEGERLADFRAFLDREGLYVALINGFPYGPFHGAPVKSNAYAPDWRDAARLDYTLDLVRILSRLLPAGMDGGISTAPLSYKRWTKSAGRDAWRAMAEQLAAVAEALVRARMDTGALMHLDIEPEPDCSLENTSETIAFFEQWLRPVGSERLASRLSCSLDHALDALHDHVTVCFDCCHFAVEFEDPVEALRRLDTARIRVGRVQLSSALKAAMSRHPDQSRKTAERLRPFADATYLHQTVEQRRDGGRRKFPDLPDALATAGEPVDREWRIHFHVPLFAAEYDGLGSTQDSVRSVIAAACRTPFTHHLEIETYTWDVLPAGLKLDVGQSIEREYRWVLDEIDRALAKTPVAPDA